MQTNIEKTMMMLEDNSEQFHKVISGIAGVVLNMCVFGHNHEPLMCGCGLKFGHKGQHKCYDKHCPFTWVDESPVDTQVISFQDTLAYSSATEVQKQIALAEVS